MGRGVCAKCYDPRPPLVLTFYKRKGVECGVASQEAKSCLSFHRRRTVLMGLVVMDSRFFDFSTVLLADRALFLANIGCRCNKSYPIFSICCDEGRQGLADSGRVITAAGAN